MTIHTKLKLEAILRKPAAVFTDPCEVLCQSRLTFDEKVDVLKKWRRDLLRAQAAPDTDIDGSDNEIIGKIDECLRQLYV